MGNEIALASLIGPIYLLIGLSLLFHANSWQNLLEKYEKDHFLLFPLMLVYVVVGFLIVRMYNVWQWNVWLLITLTGWGLLIKGVFYFLAPGAWIRPLLAVKRNKSVLYAASIIVLIMGGVLTYMGYWPPAVG